MKRLGIFFDTFWLPLFLVLSLSWLLAPALHHVQQYGALAVISHYEAVDQPYAWLFRLCDLLAAGVLAACVWRFRITAHDRLLGWLLVAIAVLAAIDALFPLGCLGTCTEPDRLSALIHDTESVLAAIALLVTTILAIRRQPHWVHIAFLGVQVVLGAIAVSGLPPHALLVVIQFIYEVVLLAWLGWLVSQFAPSAQLPRRSAYWVRRITGAATLVSGVVAMVVALPHRGGLSFLPSLAHHGGDPWLVQHGIVVGVILLYVSRHVGRGQRRAAFLLGIVMITQVIRYALFQPHPGLLIASLVVAIGLWWGRSAFDRNVEPLPITSRLQDVARVLGGVLAAVGIIILLAVTTNRQQRLYHAFDRSYQFHHHIPSHLERPAAAAVNTLIVTLTVVVLWSLFRPSNKAMPATLSDQMLAESLLRRYSNSSEDFFKIWPEDKSYFFNADRSGFIAYKRAGSIAFALADPIAPDNVRAALVDSFTAYCRQHGWTACFILVQETSLRHYEPHLKTLQIGSSAVIDVGTFVTETQREKWWRWQHNRAEKSGLRYEVVTPPHAAGLLAELQTVSRIWLHRAAHSEQGFALGYFDTHYLQRCTLHLLREVSGRLVAFSNELPRYGAVSQKTVDLIRFLPDVDGAMPVLIMRLINHLHTTGSSQTFDLGFVPLAKVEGPVGSLARRLTASRFSAAGLEQFKGKFRPEWRSNYIAYDGNIVELAILVAHLEKALKSDIPEGYEAPR